MASLDTQLRLLDRLDAVRRPRPEVLESPALTLDAVCAAQGLPLTSTERQRVLQTLPTPRRGLVAANGQTSEEVDQERARISARIRHIGRTWAWRTALASGLVSAVLAYAVLPGDPHLPPIFVFAELGAAFGLLAGMGLAWRAIERLRERREALPHTFSGSRSDGGTGNRVVA